MARGSVFCTMGGSGSTFLRRWLNQGLGVQVDHKPDTIYRRQWQADFGPNARSAEFNERSSYSPPLDGRADLTIIDEYLSWVSSQDSRTAILNTWPEQHILRHLQPRPYVFLLREPWAAYASYCEPSRHGDVASRYGGASTWLAVQFAERWRKIAEEYLALLDRGWNPILWRYEDMHVTMPSLIESGWKKSQSVDDRLQPETSTLIRQLTAEVRGALDS